MAKEDLKLRSLANPTLTAKGSELTWDELDQNFVELYNQLLLLSNSSFISAYNNAIEYNNTLNRYVIYGLQLWKFINATPQTDVTPGTDPATWEKAYATDLVHQINKDTKLDEGNANQVTAAEIRATIDEVTASGIVKKTAAAWAADTTIYATKKTLVVSDLNYEGTDQAKFKMANGVNKFSDLDYMPIGQENIFDYIILKSESGNKWKMKVGDDGMPITPFEDLGI